MARWFNIGGPCNPADNYTLPAMERLPEVAALVRKRQYFVVHFRGAVYAVEVKTRKLYEKSHEKAYEQMAKYMDRLGQPEGWLVVVDADLTKPWEGKISSEDVVRDGKPIHVITC